MDALSTFKLLASETRFTILKKLQDGADGWSITQFADEMGTSEANISHHASKLVKGGLIFAEYVAGEHGIKKVLHATEQATFLLSISFLQGAEE